MINLFEASLHGGNSLIIGFIGLPSTDDPMIGEKVANFDFFKIDQKEKLFPADRTEFKEREDHNPWEGIFSVK